ncbi:MAG TPA: thiamine phosphate synthase [Solirubrobacteraceae bacterium]|jgi:thiamine-phosphate pyrophosphorylase|nr:thiamine phosphate synthase [Solirubrobacteraceae bacterium]
MPARSDRLSELGRARRARLRDARLYLVCDGSPGGRDPRALLTAAIAGGVEIVQLREKRLRDDELLALARELAALCRRRGALFVVNDRPAVALAAGADGVHVGQDDMPLAQVRALVGADLLVGLSTHAPAEIAAVTQIEAAADSRARLRADGDTLPKVDYIGVGPVYATPTKPGRRAVGLELVRYAAAHASLPFFAIGGIHAENAASVVAAGARRLAVVRAIAGAPDPRRAARALRASLDA